MKSLIPALAALFFGALVLRAQPAVELELAEEESQMIKEAEEAAAQA